MTNILLTLIAVLRAVRTVLQLRQGKRAFENMYCASSEVENTVRIASNDYKHISSMVKFMGEDGWELVSAHPFEYRDGEILFLTRKKIKNYYEE